MKISTLGSLPLLISTLTLSASAAIDSSSFAPRLELPFAGSPGNLPGVVVGDVDGDGKLDIVAINGVDRFFVFRNISTGGSLTAASFAPAMEFATPTGPTMAGPGSIAIGDLDGDGKLDLVIVESFGGRLFIVRNTSTVGSISFAPVFILEGTLPGDPILASGGNPGVVIRDMDGDGKPDLITTRIALLRNTSTPGVLDSSSFAPAYIFDLFSNRISLAVDDLDGDGKPDVVVGSRGGGLVFVLRNSSTVGNISLDLQATLTIGCCLESVAIADLDNDGKPDIAAARLTGDNTLANLAVFQNNSTPGNLAASSFAQVDFEKGDFSRIAIADLDGDGKPDLIAANDTDGGGGSLLSVFRNIIPTGSPISSSAFAPRVTFPVSAAGVGGAGGVAIGDLDGDGKLDVVGVHYGGHWVWVFQNTTGDTAAPTITCPTNVTVPATGPTGAAVSFTVTATDDQPGVAVVSSPSSGTVFPLGTTTVNCTATDAAGNMSSCSFSVTVTGQALSALGPVAVWIGLKNSDDVGTKFDLLAEAFKNGSIIGSDELDSVPGGSSGFNNAVLRTINTALPANLVLLPGDTFSYKLSVRIAVNVSGHTSGTARLWFNDAAANSRVSATISGTPAQFFLIDNSALGTAPGPGPKKTIDVLVNKNVGGNPFKPFGTWTKTF